MVHGKIITNTRKVRETTDQQKAAQGEEASTGGRRGAGVTNVQHEVGAGRLQAPMYNFISAWSSQEHKSCVKTSQLSVVGVIYLR